MTQPQQSSTMADLDLWHNSGVCQRRVWFTRGGRISTIMIMPRELNKYIQIQSQTQTFSGVEIGTRWKDGRYAHDTVRAATSGSCQI